MKRKVPVEDISPMFSQAVQDMQTKISNGAPDDLKEILVKFKDGLVNTVVMLKEKVPGDFNFDFSKVSSAFSEAMGKMNAEKEKPKAKPSQKAKAKSEKQAAREKPAAEAKPQTPQQSEVKTENEEVSSEPEAAAQAPVETAETATPVTESENQASAENSQKSSNNSNDTSKGATTILPLDTNS